MALLDKAYKQRMVGALVLVALAVIFLPMLFSREDEQRQVVVQAPAAPQAPVMPQVQVEPVVVPEPQALPQEPVPSDDEIAIGDTVPPTPSTPAAAPSAPIAPAPVVAKPVMGWRKTAILPGPPSGWDASGRCSAQRLSMGHLKSSSQGIGVDSASSQSVDLGLQVFSGP